MYNPVIIHLDGDAFFASVEVAKRPHLRGKPVVTGHERGIATAMSYEAKKLGVTRAMPIFQIRKLFPQVTVLESDYDSYHTYSDRMMRIVERHVDTVERYSIDECFACLYSPDEKNLESILKRIKEEITRELDITVSLGAAPTKVLAKIASKYNKPNGLTIMKKDEIDSTLAQVSIGSIWGVGRSSAPLLRNLGIATALDLKNRDEKWVKEHLHKNLREIWEELNERSVKYVSNEDEAPQSIAHTRSFTKTNDKKILAAELAHHVTEACERAREAGMLSRAVYVFIKTAEFRYKRNSALLPEPSSSPSVIAPIIRSILEELYDPHLTYRASGITLSDLVPENAVGTNLFESEKNNIWPCIDQINMRYGGGAMTLASTLGSVTRKKPSFNKRLSIPFLGNVY